MERVGKAGSKFDFDKTKWFNQQYLRAKSKRDLAKELQVILKTNEIEKILVDDHRKMEINYSRYTQIKEHKIKLPLYVELKTDTFTMQINIQNDIIINNKNLNEKKPL